MLRLPRILAVAASLAAASPAAAADCHAAAAESVDRFLTRDDVFRPLLADPKEPRFSASYQRIRFRTGEVRSGRDTDTIHSGFVQAGQSIGLWSRRRGCDGVQIGLFAGVHSQFDLSIDSGDLINTDYLVGMPITWRAGPWSWRGRILHQSSHLGDEFLLRNRSVRVKNFGFEMVDALLSFEEGRWRAYGGGGAVFHSATDFDPLVFQAGLEVQSREPLSWRPWGLVPTPVAGVDFKTWQQQDWGPTWNVVAGIELSRPNDTVRVRLLANLLAGHFPYAQFFDETTVRSVGLGIHLEL